MHAEVVILTGENTILNADGGDSRAAQARRDAALFGWEVLHNQLVYQVAEAYYRLLQARNLDQLRLESVTQVQQHLRIAQTRFEAGQVVKSDMLSVEVRLAEVREALVRSGNQLKLAWAILENVAGCTIDRRDLPATAGRGAQQSRRHSSLERSVRHGGVEDQRMRDRPE